MKLEVCGFERIRTDTDSEGVTTLVVSMGCPLRCAYCLNPFTWDGSKVKLISYTKEELYDALKIDNLYFLATGGGVVFGGGEPLLNHSFIRDFIETYKNTGWKFSIESSLNVQREYLDDVIDIIDYFIVDTKDMNKERYEKYTGGNYDLFFGNLKYLLERRGPKSIKVRVPYIFDFHKNNEHEENALILKEMGFEDINVFYYVDPAKRKKISDCAMANRNKLIEK